MKAIRGATTVDFDSIEQVRARVGELLKEIVKRNALTRDEIVFLLFSNTNDICSYYPAKAAREAGFSFCSLFSAAEPDMSGGLEKCIRVLALTEKCGKPEHVYLHGAASLRRDYSKIINIALDGPAGGGKSTVSKLVAETLGILCLDTGAMYRACALKCMYENADCGNEIAVKPLIDKINIEVKYIDGSQRTFLDGKDVSEEIRKPQISMSASTVSSLDCVRKKMVDLQRKIAAETSCILDGRDIGTNVLPDAEFKFFLTADAEVRAQRRFKELTEKGHTVDFESLKTEIILRDEQDKMRKIAPLRQADDAVFIDSSAMNAEEVAAFIVRKIQEKI